VGGKKISTTGWRPNGSFSARKHKKGSVIETKRPILLKHNQKNRGSKGLAGNAGKNKRAVGRDPLPPKRRGGGEKTVGLFLKQPPTPTVVRKKNKGKLGKGKKGGAPLQKRDPEKLVS